MMSFLLAEVTTLGLLGDTPLFALLQEGMLAERAWEAGATAEDLGIGLGLLEGMEEGREERVRDMVGMGLGEERGRAPKELADLTSLEGVGPVPG